MTFTDEQRTKRYELENRQEPLTPAERVLLAALNDLKEANEGGKDIEACEQSVKAAEKLLGEEDKTKGKTTEVTDISDVPAGGDDVRRVKLSESGKK